jgi:hypothetical protein
MLKPAADPAGDPRPGAEVDVTALSVVRRLVLRALCLGVPVPIVHMRRSGVARPLDRSVRRGAHVQVLVLVAQMPVPLVLGREPQLAHRQFTAVMPSPPALNA